MINRIVKVKEEIDYFTPHSFQKKRTITFQENEECKTLFCYCSHLYILRQSAEVVNMGWWTNEGNAHD